MSVCLCGPTAQNANANQHTPTTKDLFFQQFNNNDDDVNDEDDVDNHRYQGMSASVPFNNNYSGDEVSVEVRRLVDWNTDVLLRLLKQIAAKRMIASDNNNNNNNGNSNANHCNDNDSYNMNNANDMIFLWSKEEEPQIEYIHGQIVFDEVTDVIDLPGFSPSRTSMNLDDIELPDTVEIQLRAYVFAVANAYHSNPFHCLQHASQVTMALTKMLSRIVVKRLDGIDEEDDYSDSDEETTAAATTKEVVNVPDSIAPHLHNHTYGITSDPLTQFGLVFAAFIHAVDHNGLPNAEIAKEDPEAAALYKNRSIIEQRSVDKAWRKLMEPPFYELRQWIYSDLTELKRFRQVVVNSVLATDIEDEELQNLRMKRWEKSFSRGHVDVTLEDVNRKATIVIEHLMQASDIFHTMQPWIVYEKWSTRHFGEKHLAYKEGRSKEDPSQTWYQTELEFFDNYAIPLAMQLKECDAFVVGSDEYLNYTLRNRQQLAAKGQGMVTTMLQRINGDQGVLSPLQRMSLRNIFNNSERKAEADDQAKLSRHVQRLVDWNVEMLQRLLRQVVAKRTAAASLSSSSSLSLDTPILEYKVGHSLVDEVVEIIEFPPYDASTAPETLDPDSVVLNETVLSQLREYVTFISSRFRDNPFHGLDHGSHVCMTTRKLLSRMVTNPNTRGIELHNRTYGISSDPLSQFAIVFAALIHNVDHQGVPNKQLVNENSDLAMQYNNRCVSEQHSIDLSWNYLMRPEFGQLRSCIYRGEIELKRFRQIVVNSVLATTLTDTELLTFRKHRQEKAFGTGQKNNNDASSQETMNRKATVVIETLLQASDIFHATQNWHLYQKWNERHFSEAYKSFQDGRLHEDPRIVWYRSELLFFDDHVVHIAKQLNDCGVFDTTGDEYLSFALSNRQQWAAKGGDLVASMVARYHGKEIAKQTRSKRSHRRLSLSAKTA